MVKTYYINLIIGFIFICILGCSNSNSQIADKYFGAGEYLKAVDEYTYVIAEDPNNLHAYLNRGKAYHELQKYNLALIDYSVVIKMDPKNKDAYIFRGYIYESQSNYYKALIEYNIAISLDSKDPVTYIDRADAYYALKEYIRALEDYAKALSISPDNEMAKSKIEYMSSEEFFNSRE